MEGRRSMASSSDDAHTPFLDELGFISNGHSYSRKLKSLGLLCTKFLSLYNRDGVECVCLDEAAGLLGVERRRIYDIVNIIESVGILARKAKNMYSWIGFSGIPKSLERLKEEITREVSQNPGRNPFAYTKTTHCLDEDKDEKLGCKDNEMTDEALPIPAKTSSAIPCSNNRPGNRREKSLGQLTQNFIKLFLIKESNAISLHDASRLLLSDGYNSSQMRTKVRRLYDIANVLASLSLIEKTQDLESRKPTFRWLGVGGCSNATSTVEPSTKKSNKRSFGSDITNIDIKRSKLNSLAGDKPRKVLAKTNDIRQCNLTAHRQLQTSKDYTFGPFMPAPEFKIQNNKEEKSGEKINEWEAVASTFHLQCQNQALSDLFAHYMEAWKVWYAEVAHGGELAAVRGIHGTHLL